MNIFKQVIIYFIKGKSQIKDINPGYTEIKTINISKVNEQTNENLENKSFNKEGDDLKNLHDVIKINLFFLEKLY